MQFCGKHDIVFAEGKSCWCCDQDKEKPAEVEEEKKSETVPPTDNPNK